MYSHQLKSKIWLILGVIYFLITLVAFKGFIDNQLPSKVVLFWSMFAIATLSFSIYEENLKEAKSPT